MPYSGLAFWTCFSDLVSAVATADITPGELSKAASKVLRNQWIRTILYGFVFVVVAGATM
jgi:hypothetical protein